MKEILTCPKCGSEDVVKAGLDYQKAGTKQRYQCKNPNCPAKGARGGFITTNPVVKQVEESVN